MSSLAVCAIVFACIFGGALVGMVLRAKLPQSQMSDESKDVVKLGTGLIGTMTALVLGLLVASAKSGYDTQRNGLAQLSGNVILLDRTLANYGPGAEELRGLLREAVTDMWERTWPEEQAASKKREDTEGRYEHLFKKIQDLTPKSDAQKALQAQALKIVGDAAQTRWLLFAQRDSSIATPLLVVMAAWLSLIFVSFGLFSPRNSTAMVALLICALVVSSSIFLILELDRPFDGIIKLSSSPIRNALAMIGR